LLTKGRCRRDYRAALCVACLSGRSASSLRRRASRTAFPRWSVRNDHLNYRAGCSALLPVGRGSELAHEGGRCRRDYRAALCVACLSGRSASSLRRRASRTAFPRWSVRNDHLNYRARCSALLPEGRGSELAHEGQVLARLSCGAPRRMPFWTLRVLLTTQSVENCIPTLEREERSSQLSCPMLRASARRAWE